MTTVFEKILAGDISVDIVHENRFCMVIRDIHPQAPVHLVILPKRKITNLAEAYGSEDFGTLGVLLLTAAEVAKNQGLEKYRVVINNKTDKHTVPYLHVHLLGGREMEWPPG